MLRTVIVLSALIVVGAAFVGGYVARGPGDGERAPEAVPTSCSAAEVLGVVRDWKAASDAYNATDLNSHEEDRAFTALDAQETRLRTTLAKCS